ncbi:MAG: HAMP domain-containing sensor histidine kinase [Arcobacteraceae bacterium]|nr:HAMP domain-containing sensor histidine kinase [Arcobacteraceae bacterium]
MKIFKNIKFRLLAVLFIFLFIIFYAFGYLLASSLKKSYNDINNATLSTITKDLQHELLTEKYDIDKFEIIKKEFDINIFYAQILIVDDKNVTIKLKSKDLKNSVIPFDRNELLEFSGNTVYLKTGSLDNIKYIKIATIVLKKNNNDDAILLQCAIPFEKHNPYVHEVENILWFWLLLLLFVVLIIVYFMISKSLSATKLVVDEVNQIKIDGHFHKLNTTGISSEIDELIKTFNLLIYNLQNSYKKVKDFGQNASHELKTPLTIIRGEIEVGLRKERSNGEYKVILQSLMGEVELLQEIIEKILFLSSNANEDIIKNFEEVYIDEIFSEAIKEKTQLAFAKNIRLNIVSLEPLTKLGNPTLLKIAITNLLDNAIKYSKENQSINLTLDNNSLIIEDFGCGIPTNEIEKVFDRFYRVQKIKNYSKGNGLGLAIVKTILDIHQFTIKVESVEDRYTKVTIIF